MASGTDGNRWQTDGKFFRSGGRRVWMRAVTYGPFPPNPAASHDRDFAEIAAAGFNAIRVFEMPDLELLNTAANHGLVVFGGLAWGTNVDFFRNPGVFTAAAVALAAALRETADHPALAGVYVGNEVPADLVRWMGPLRVRQALEELIEIGRELAPGLLFAYASYPSTEYLEPENADFTALNVYLETEDAFRAYLKRLHHIAGDRPLVISEFGLDSLRNGREKQAEILSWATRAAHELETAGMTIYAWSDRWSNGGAEVIDWDFGMMDRDGNPKPALTALAALELPSPAPASELFSVIVCTRNGRSRIGNCLNALARMTDGAFETIVVDDGSTDDTADFVAKHFPSVRLLRLEPSGLGTARNAGAAAARGTLLAFTDDDCEPDQEWLTRLRPIFQDGKFGAAGGPNLPPAPRSAVEAVVCAAPGAPSHVMLDDEEAEHLPGCNIAVTKAAFQEIGGFDPMFHTAGDDVDFCWRLHDAGVRLGFAPGAFVWHWRRPSVSTFLRQQLGYGRAERLLLAKHPERFSETGHARWRGFVYGGGPVRVMEHSVIYHGPLGDAGYQNITNRMLPLRGLQQPFRSASARLALGLVEFLQPRLRAWMRNRRILWNTRPHIRRKLSPPTHEFLIHSPHGLEREQVLSILLRYFWQPASATAPWDVEQPPNRRVAVATERHTLGATTTLIRVWGYGASSVERILRRDTRENPQK